MRSTRTGSASGREPLTTCASPWRRSRAATRTAASRQVSAGSEKRRSRGRRSTERYSVICARCCALRSDCGAGRVPSAPLCSSSSESESPASSLAVMASLLTPAGVTASSVTSSSCLKAFLRTAVLGSAIMLTSRPTVVAALAALGAPASTPSSDSSSESAPPERSPRSSPRDATESWDLRAARMSSSFAPPFEEGGAAGAAHVLACGAAAPVGSLPCSRPCSARVALIDRKLSL
mmetsp:Transcript_26887/g.79240  ORF Transcript_26887/g.79240 Transcript_26887/m.79240 type:complete len:235 (-) Transcript_26887:276-980(-)